ncbi:MAG: prenyltransferase [Sandaracinaceae bacterium]
MTARAWFRAARPLAHANIAPPILLGVAFAHAMGFALDPVRLAVAFAFGVFDHLFIVFANDYADREADAHHDAPTLFSGGSRVIQDGLLTPAQLKRAAWVSAAGVMAVSTVGAVVIEAPFLPALGAAALVLLHAYSFAPLSLSYRGFGEVLQGLGVGVVLPLVGWASMTSRVADAPFEALAPLFLIAFASNILTALPDVEADRAAGKLSWPVRRGERTARRDALVLTGIGVLLATQVGPPLTVEWRVLMAAAPLLSLFIALRWINRADAAQRDACLRFVTLVAGAATLLHLGWAGALMFA